MKSITLLVLLLVASCSSGKIVPTTDVCTIKKHYKDNIFQVYINKNPISNHWYIYQDAKVVTSKLADQNLCIR